MWRPIIFSLAVGELQVKYKGIQHVKHLNNVLEKNYKVTVNWKGKFFYCITLDWNYKTCHVNLSIPRYVGCKLTKY